MNVQKIKDLCNAKGINFAQLERAAGIGNGTIGKWRTCSPRVSTLKKVADYFGVSVDALLPDTLPDEGS